MELQQPANLFTVCLALVLNSVDSTFERFTCTDLNPKVSLDRLKPMTLVQNLIAHMLNAIVNDSHSGSQILKCFFHIKVFALAFCPIAIMSFFAIVSFAFCARW